MPAEQTLRARVGVHDEFGVMVLLGQLTVSHTFRKRQETLAIENEFLQVDQLADAFGQRGHAPSR